MEAKDSSRLDFGGIPPKEKKFEFLAKITFSLLFTIFTSLPLSSPQINYM